VSAELGLTPREETIRGQRFCQCVNGKKETAVSLSVHGVFLNAAASRQVKLKALASIPARSSAWDADSCRPGTVRWMLGPGRGRTAARRSSYEEVLATGGPGRGEGNPWQDGAPYSCRASPIGPPIRMKRSLNVILFLPGEKTAQRWCTPYAGCPKGGLFPTILFVERFPRFLVSGRPNFNPYYGCRT